MQQDLAMGSSNYYLQVMQQLIAQEVVPLSSFAEDNRLALLMVALEQSVVDGDWTVAFLLSLAEDPPISLFLDKTSTMSPFGKPFSSLVPPPWASVVLAYVKEMEVLQSRKPESPKRTPKAADPDAPSPKRRPRFPKKPRPDQDAAKRDNR